MRRARPQEAGDSRLVITYIGGPTALLEWGGLRFLTDPTFDPAGTEYPLPLYTLRKREGPARSVRELGAIDGVLLSHDHHFDNLDRAGREMLASAQRVLTTAQGAARLAGAAVGLANWETIEIPAPDGRVLHVVGTPARHGPPQGDRGPVTGFILFFAETPKDCVYVSGDTVWYEGVEEVARRFEVKTALLFMGAAVVREVGPDHLTMTGAEGVRAAKAFHEAAIVPLHHAGWEHFTESAREIERAFAGAGLSSRLHWLEPGVPRAFPSEPA